MHNQGAPRVIEDAESIPAVKIAIPTTEITISMIYPSPIPIKIAKNNANHLKFRSLPLKTIMLYIYGNVSLFLVTSNKI